MSLSCCLASASSLFDFGVIVRLEYNYDYFGRVGASVSNQVDHLWRGEVAVFHWGASGTFICNILTCIWFTYGLVSTVLIETNKKIITLLS